MNKCAKIAILIFLATIWSFSCKVPTPPKWDTEINIPVGDGIFYLSDLLKDIDFIKLDSIPEICFTDTLDTMRMGENIKVYDSYEICSSNIGNFNIKDINSTKVKLTLIEIWSECPPGSSKVPVPTTSTVHLEDFGYIPNFAWARFSEGEIVLKIRNYLNLPIHFVNIKIRDTYGTVLIQDSLSVSANSDSYCIGDLSALYVTSNLVFEIDVNTPGTGIDSVWVSPNDSVLVWVESQSPLVDSANAWIPSMAISDTCRIGLLTDFDTIDSLELRKGILNLTINNETELEGDFNLAIPDIGFDTSFYMYSKDVRDIFISLKNRVLHFDGDPIFEIISHFNTDSSFNTLSRDDSLATQVALSDLEMQSITGRISDTIKVDFAKISIALNLPRGASLVKFGSVNIRLWLANTMDKFNAYLNLSVAANEYRRNFLLHLYAVTTDTTFDIADIVNSALTSDSAQINIDGEVFVFDSLSIQYDDYIVGEMSISIPFRFTFNADTIYSDTLTDSTIVDMATNLRVATLNVNLKNRFPIGMGMRLVIVHESDTLSKTFAIPAAPYEPITGIAIGEADTILSIGLSEGEASIFTKKPRYEWFELYIPGTAGDTITMQTSDYVKVSGYVTFKVRL